MNNSQKIKNLLKDSYDIFCMNCALDDQIINNMNEEEFADLYDVAGDWLKDV